MANPDDYWQAANNLAYDLEVSGDSPFYVDTSHVRGSFSRDVLYKRLSINPNTLALIAPKNRQYLLFVGHRGCGKSTELRYLSHQTLHHNDRYFVVFLDILKELDSNNLHYTDIFLGLAKLLCKQLDENDISLPQVYLTRMENWFGQHIITRIKSNELSSHLETGLKAGGGLPGIASLFAKLTNAIRFSTSDKDEVRLTLQATFSEFAESFNQLIMAANEALKAANKGQKLLFVVDGTDRLNDEDTEKFFVSNVNQLQMINANFIYAVQNHFIYKSNLLAGRFDHIQRMPMIKLYEKDNPEKIEPAFEIMRQMLSKRISPILFDNAATIDFLIHHSGGHPRELMQLVYLAWTHAEQEILDQKAADKAIQERATLFRLFLLPEDYTILHAIDHQQEPDITDRVRFLINNLAILEYNGIWFRSHPVVRQLPGYKAISPPPSHG